MNEITAQLVTNQNEGGVENEIGLLVEPVHDVAVIHAVAGLGLELEGSLLDADVASYKIKIYSFDTN